MNIEDNSKTNKDNKNKTIYFMGIGGTGMAAVAGLCKEAGFNVIGSDKGVYPPMSTMLQNLKIPVFSPYSVDNLKDKINDIDIVVVANALSRGNPEIEFMLENKLNYKSFPQLLGDFFLKDKTSIVVSGTHGKTTTSSLITHVLSSLREHPSYLIGGVPQGYQHSFKLDGDLFVIEGDEYDTAFFDKGSKFLHYHPKYLILNNLEYDHADIFKSIDDIIVQFVKLINLVEDKSNIICNVDDPVLFKIVKDLNILDQCTKVSTLGKNNYSDIQVIESSPLDENFWQAEIKINNPSFLSLFNGEHLSTLGTIKVKTQLFGPHNISNVSQVFALISKLMIDSKVDKSRVNLLFNSISSFKGVKRRLEHLGSYNGIDIYEDFAHHPTAIRNVIDSFKKTFPNKKVVVAFEPANATGRRNVLIKEFADSLKHADKVLIGVSPLDLRIEEGKRMNTKELKELVGDKASYFDRNEDILSYIKDNAQSNDAIIFMSSSSFSGIQHKILDELKDRK